MLQQRYGVVTNDGLNLHIYPDTLSACLARIPSTTTIVIEDHDDIWDGITYGTLSGYVMKENITPLSVEKDTILHGKCTEAKLNLYRTTCISADRLVQIPGNVEMDVMDYDSEGEWYRATYMGFTGYLVKKYSGIATMDSMEWFYGRVTSKALNIRKEPSTSAFRWNYVWPINRIALIKESASGWYQTLYRGEEAYVTSKFVEKTAEPAVASSIVERIQYLAIPELGRHNSAYFNSYSGEWCHRFADWLIMHAAMPNTYIPNTSNCGTGLVWFVTNSKSGGFYFKNSEHKMRIVGVYHAIGHLSKSLTSYEEEYIPAAGDYVYLRWGSAASSVNVSHVGIVRSIEGDSLTTFEGNCSGKVVSRSFTLSNKQIIGYGKPEYRFVI